MKHGTLFLLSGGEEMASGTIERAMVRPSSVMKLAIKEAKQRVHEGEEIVYIARVEAIVRRSVEVDEGPVPANEAHL